MTAAYWIKSFKSLNVVNFDELKRHAPINIMFLSRENLLMMVTV